MGLSDTEKAALKKIAVQRLAKEFVTRLAASASFFGWPVVGQVTTFFVSILINFIIEWTSLGITLVSIWVANKEEAKKAVEAREELDKKIKNKEDTKDAERRFNETADNLVKLRIVGV